MVNIQSLKALIVMFLSTLSLDTNLCQQVEYQSLLRPRASMRRDLPAQDYAGGSYHKYQSWQPRQFLFGALDLDLSTAAVNYFVKMLLYTLILVLGLHTTGERAGCWC